MQSTTDYLQVALAVIAILVAFKLTASILGLAVRLALVVVLLVLAAYWLGVLPDEYASALTGRLPN
jgi:hypothetical protein